MSSQDEGDRGRKEDSLLLKAIQQQFELMNVKFEEIRDRLELQDLAIANLHRAKSPQVANARQQQRRVVQDDSEGDEGDKLQDDYQPPRNMGRLA